MTKLTAVPADNLIILNNQLILFDKRPFPDIPDLDDSIPVPVHAIFWNGTSGFIEYEITPDGKKPNRQLDQTDYSSIIEPLEEAALAELLLIKAEQEAEKEAFLQAYNSEESRFARLRDKRDRRLAESDYLMLPDYIGVDDAIKLQVVAYRQALRDLPDQEGAPWDGGGPETPWPAIPRALPELARKRASLESNYKDNDMDIDI